MPKIASSNVEVYIRQLLSETLGDDAESRNHAENEEVLNDEKINLTDRKLIDESNEK